MIPRKPRENKYFDIGVDSDNVCFVWFHRGVHIMDPKLRRDSNELRVFADKLIATADWWDAKNDRT